MALNQTTQVLPNPPTLTSAAKLGRRDAAIDTIRGVCIVLMTVSHLAEGTVVDKVLHPAPWVDGASGFVLMSGLVLGLVQPGRISRVGLRGAEIQLARRALLLYVIHVSTVFLALGAGSLAPTVDRFPHTGDHGGWPGTVAATLLLQVNPADIDILSLYVILLLSAMVAAALLARGLAWLVALASIALYVVASTIPAAFTLPIGEGHLSKFNWGAWQLLFLSAFVVGWFWKKRNLREVLASRGAFTLAAGLWFVVTLVGVLFARFGLAPAIQPALTQAYYDKTDQGLGRFVLSWVAFVTIYAGLTWLMRRRALRALAPVERLGKRSLAAFVVLTVITVLVPLIAGHEVDGPLSIAIAAAALLTMYTYVLLRYGRERVPSTVVPEQAPAR